MRFLPSPNHRSCFFLRSIRWLLQSFHLVVKCFFCVSVKPETCIYILFDMRMSASQTILSLNIVFLQHFNHFNVAFFFLLLLLRYFALTWWFIFKIAIAYSYKSQHIYVCTLFAYKFACWFPFFPFHTAFGICVESLFHFHHPKKRLQLVVFMFMMQSAKQKIKWKDVSQRSLDIWILSRFFIHFVVFAFCYCWLFD